MTNNIENKELNVKNVSNDNNSLNLTYTSINKINHACDTVIITITVSKAL